MNTMSTPLSGHQFSLAHGEYRAIVASVGASLRVLRHRDRELVVPYAPDEVRPAFRGAILAPWPNRVINGRYTDGGQVQQLGLTEPERGHALHGLLVWHDFTDEEIAPDRIVLVARLPAQQGYPHPLQVRVEYRLDDDGLSTTVTGTNLGRSVAPWGTGPHPYLVAGAGRVDQWFLELPAQTVLKVTPDRLIPDGLADVIDLEGGRFDFRTERSLSGAEIDHAFTDMSRDADGRATVRVVDQIGKGVAMICDSSCPWIQIHTADRPEPELNRIGLAVEPMTCAPDAFNSRAGLVRLPPGGSHSARWRIQALEGRQ